MQPRLSLLAASLLLLAVPSRPTAHPRGERVPGEAGATLARALDTIRTEHLSADLHFLASDELMGRDTPSQGLRHAARFIRARLMRLGFTPAGDDGGYFHGYRLVRAGLDLEHTSATLWRGGEGTQLAFGEDYYFFPSGVGALDVRAGVAWGGTGSPQDLEGLDLAGRWVLVRSDDREALRPLGDALQARGAAGLVIASPAGAEDQHASERSRRVARWVGRGGLRVAGDPDHEPFPVLFVTHGVAAALLGGSEPALGALLPVELADRRRLDAGAEPIRVENVAGLWPGSDPTGRGEVIVVSAHYDHVGVEGTQIFNGADDNGSGTAGMLAIAEALATYGPLQRSVLLLWVSGEEKGLLGSEAWTKDPTLPEGMRPVCALNIDMIGRNAPDQLLITPTSEHPAYNGLTRIFERLAPLEGFTDLGGCDEYWGRSDHANFSRNLGIPVAFLFADIHEDYHKPTDTVEKLDFDKIRRVTRLVVRMVDALQHVELAEL